MTADGDIIEWKAPAKINWWLRILRRRDDGFHEIETRIYPLRLHDVIRVRRAEAAASGEIFLECSKPGVPAGRSNLVVKVLRELAREGFELPPLHIQLRNRERRPRRHARLRYGKRI